MNNKPHHQLFYLGRVLFKHCAQGQGLNDDQLTQRIQQLQLKGVVVTKPELIQVCSLNQQPSLTSSSFNQPSLNPSFKQESKYTTLLKLTDNELAAIEETVEVLTKRNIPEDVIDAIVADLLREPSFDEVYFDVKMPVLNVTPQEYIMNKRIRAMTNGGSRPLSEEDRAILYSPVSSKIEEIVDTFIADRNILQEEVMGLVSNKRLDLSREPQFRKFYYRTQLKPEPIHLEPQDALYLYLVLWDILSSFYTMNMQTKIALLNHPRFKPVLNVMLHTLQQLVENKQVQYYDVHGKSPEEQIQYDRRQQQMYTLEEKIKNIL